MMPNDPSVRMYGLDVTVLGYTQNAVAKNVLAFFRDVTLNVEIEHAQSWSPGDTLTNLYDGTPGDLIQGFVQNKFKARRWSLELNTNMVAGGLAPSNRMFGWNVSAETLAGVDVFGLATNLEFSVNCETMEARVPTDTLSVANGGVGGWGYPRIKNRNFELAFTGRVDKAVTANNPMDLLFADDPDLFEGLAFEITNGAVFSIAGTNATLGSGSYTFGEEAAEQQVRLLCNSVPPTISGSAPPPLLAAILGKNSTGEITRSEVVAVRVSNPGGSVGTAVLQGDGFFSTARGSITDDANVESGTITGVGPLAKAA